MGRTVCGVCKCDWTERDGNGGLPCRVVGKLVSLAWVALCLWNLM